jgi:hypothetical protein
MVWVPTASLTLSVALRDPVAAGLNLTETVQVVPAASDPVQVLVKLKSPGLAPEIVKPLKTNVAVPVFVAVTVSGPLVVFTVCAAKISDVGDQDTPGAVPSPLSCTVCGLEGSESLIESVALLVPVAVGVNRR